MRSILAERLGYKKFSTGDFTRELAAERGITLEAFNELIANSKDIDLLIDAELERIEHEEDFYIVDSHLAFHFIPSGFSVYLDISLDTSAERVFNDKHAEIRIKSGDTMKTLEEAKMRTKKRILNHEERYLRHYGIDPYVASQYTHTIDAEKYNQAEVADQIIAAYEVWLHT
jgi:cytidylate kinase